MGRSFSCHSAVLTLSARTNTEFIVWGHSPPVDPPSLEIESKLWVSQATPTSEQLATNRGLPAALSGLIVQENDSSNSGKCYFYDCSLFIKDAD